MKIDTVPLEFGKYKGLTPLAVGELDPAYLVWLYINVKPERCSKTL